MAFCVYRIDKEYSVPIQVLHFYCLDVHEGLYCSSMPCANRMLIDYFMIERGDNESKYFHEKMNIYTNWIWFPLSERKSLFSASR